MLSVLGIVLAVGAAFYLFLELKTLLAYLYHKRRLDGATEDTIHTQISVLLRMEKYALARALYEQSLVDPPTPDRVRPVAHRLLLASLCIPVGGVLTRGVTALSDPLLQNALTPLGITVVGSGILLAGHVIHFRVKLLQSDPDALSVLANSLDSIYQT